MTESIEAGEVHVWYVLTDEVAEPELLAAYERLLRGEELARHRRLMIDRVRHEHLLTRALARTCLSRYVDVPPEAWDFEMNRWGRPEIAAPEEARWLRFNLSNTHGLVACAVARDLEVGVDAEYVERRTTPVEIADRFFSAEEVAALHRLEGEHAQRERFFDYWTLKESYIKARGMGLAIPLGDFSFHLDEDPGAVRISFAPTLDDDPSTWSFWRARPTPLHRIATAVRCGAAMAPREVRVSLRRVVPLVG